MHKRHPLQVLGRAVVLVSIMFVLGVAGWAIGRNHDTATSAKVLAQRIERESNERRDQTCSLFERDHLQDVQRLRDTYAYLKDLPEDEKRLSLNPHDPGATAVA